MITSDAISWNAPNDDHPARSASQRSYSAVAKGDLEEWLTVYAEDALLEDPVGPSMFDAEGTGHRGHEGIRAFWNLAIAPVDTFHFEIDGLVRQSRQQHVRQRRAGSDLVCGWQPHDDRPDHGLRRR